MNLMHIFAFLSLLTCIEVFAQNKDFCQEFVNNYNKISYGFRRQTASNQRIDYNYLVIGKEYWKVNVLDTVKIRDEITLSFHASSSSESDFFGSDYLTAWSLWRTPSAVVGLLKSDRKTIEWLYIKGDTGEDKEVPLMKDNSDNSLPKTTSITFNNFEPTIAFTPTSVLGITSYHVVFLQQKLSESVNTLKLYEFNEKLIGTEINDTLKAIPIALKELKTNLEIIAIFPHMENTDTPFTDTDPGIVILFKDEKTIKYCYTDNSDKCDTSKLKTLIDCKAYTPKSTTTQMTTTTESAESSMSWILIAIGLSIIVVILIVIITLLWCICRNKGNTDNTSKATKTSTTVPSVKSKLSTKPSSSRTPSAGVSRTPSKGSTFSKHFGVKSSTRSKVPLKS